MKKVTIIVSLILAMVVVLVFSFVLCSCSSTSLKVWESPDIRVRNVLSETSWSFSLGYYADVRYTLHNAGKAAGQATVEIKGDYSGRLLTQYVTVGAGQTVRETVRVDTNQRDNNVYVTVTRQVKVE